MTPSFPTRRSSYLVNEMGHAELAPPFFSVGIDIDADDHVGARHLRALKHVEADAAETENDDIVAGNDLRRVHDCADASGDTATDIAAGDRKSTRLNSSH